MSQRYVINTRERRIHRADPKETCNTDDMLGRVTRDLTTDEFLDLMNKDYVLCQHCMMPNVLTELNEGER